MCIFPSRHNSILAKYQPRQLAYICIQKRDVYMLSATLKLLLAGRTCKIKFRHVTIGGVFIIS